MSIQDTFDTRQTMITPIVEAIAAQTNSYFDDVLPREANAAVAQRRQELTNRARVTDSLKFPEAWAPAPPTLVNPPTPPKTSGAASDVKMERTPRLSPASFQDVQQIIRTLADAVERTPIVFGKLSEDQLSDLLAATLNATVPGAKREVYSTTGKADIFIEADVLSVGSGPAKVFLCESKFTYDHDTVRKALDPQLFSYLNASDTAAILLLLVIQKDFATARTTYSEVLKALPDYRSEEGGAVEGWPVLRFEHDSRFVDVCVATVAVPR